MRILEHRTVPTGDILIVEGLYGKLEMLSLGDYGKEINLCRKPVVHGPLLPLEEKWVITISTQYGCSMRCAFCDVPKVGPGRNATFNDLCRQIQTGLNLHQQVTASRRLNIHFARMGEPTWNPNVLDCGSWIREHLSPMHHCHPVVSTMMPRRNLQLMNFIDGWMRIKNQVFEGEAGLQLSINSTDEIERRAMFNDSALSLGEIAYVMRHALPIGRKITLNFAVAGYDVDPEKLLRFFSPDRYVCKLTPMHKTAAALANGVQTAGDYTTPEPYLDIEARLKAAGYKVLVFIASREEDESRITCGNAILAEAR